MFRISWKKDGGEDLEAFYPIRPECRPNVPKTRFKSRVGKTLSARRWHAAFSEDGHLDIAKVLRRIQRGGIHPSIKGLVWEFLLGCFDPSSTFDERNQIRQRRREQYGTWKAECQSMVPVIGSGKIIMASIITDNGQPIQNSSINGYLEDQGGHASNVVSDKKVIEWKLLLHQIGLDVARTDRTLVFYESETNQAKLWDILAVYAWVDNDIGYVQGMNDICSPMVILFENEADAFWCFEHAMRRLRENFRCSASSMGVQTQLSALSQVIKTIDPKLHQHLEDLDGGEYLFAFRMLMVLFRREFSFVDALYLWELMWAMEYNPNIFSSYEEPKAATDKGVAPISDKLLKQCGKFARKNVETGHTDQNNAFAVYLVASVLETKNKQLLKDAKGLDDVAKILGDTTGNLDAKKACNEALKIHKKYLTKKVPSEILPAVRTLLKRRLSGWKLSYRNGGRGLCSARMKGSIFTYPLEGIKHLMSEEGEMLTKPFLDVCKNLLPVLDNFGSAMALVKSDVGGNISRLESKYLSNPSEFNLLYNLVRAEVKAKTAKASSSCTNALLWLTRAMDFLVELFRNLLAHPNWTMSQACNDAYNKTLKKWNNWLASSSFNVAMKLVPDRKKFMDIIDGTGDFNTEIENFCANFCPLLQQNHKFLNGVGMDNMKAS